MAKQKHWSIIIDDTPYEIDFYKNKISINGGPYSKLGALAKSSNLFHGANAVSVGDKMLMLHTQPMAEPVLTYEGLNCETNEPYTPAEFPKWGWIFIILHGINFFLLIGGAIGGILVALFLWPTAGIAMNKNKSTVTRVFQCIGVWLVATIIEFIIALFMISATA